MIADLCFVIVADRHREGCPLGTRDSMRQHVMAEINLQEEHVQLSRDMVVRSWLFYYQ